MREERRGRGRGEVEGRRGEVEERKGKETNLTTFKLLLHLKKAELQQSSVFLSQLQTDQTAACNMINGNH